MRKVHKHSLGNKNYTFIYCSVIAEVKKHLKNMFQQALGPKVLWPCVYLYKYHFKVDTVKVMHKKLVVVLLNLPSL